eukprot:2300997-Pleurochrysis_carterae.AAC.1
MHLMAVVAALEAEQVCVFLGCAASAGRSHRPAVVPRWPLQNFAALPGPWHKALRLPPVGEQEVRSRGARARGHLY